MTVLWKSENRVEIRSIHCKDAEGVEKGKIHFRQDQQDKVKSNKAFTMKLMKNMKQKQPW